MVPDTITADPVPNDGVEGLRVLLVGKFDSLPRREAAAAIVRRGGDVSDDRPDLVVIGEAATAAQESRATDVATEAGAKLIRESELWRRLGLLEDTAGVRKLYSLGMLAETVGASVSVVRRWLRRGLLQPVSRVNRLAYFDFGEARVAQLLATAISQGATLADLERRADRLAAAYPECLRPLAELPVIVVDGELLVRDGIDLTEPTGQRRLAFEPNRDDPIVREPVGPAVLPLEVPEPTQQPDSLRERAWLLSEEGDTRGAIEAWRLVLLESEPSAEDHAQLADWLAQVGESEAACERYYAALELDADLLDARVNLGRLLTNQGELDLAIAAFRGAIQQQPDFADAHYFSPKPRRPL